MTASLDSIQTLSQKHATQKIQRIKYYITHYLAKQKGKSKFCIQPIHMNNLCNIKNKKEDLHLQHNDIFLFIITHLYECALQKQTNKILWELLSYSQSANYQRIFIPLICINKSHPLAQGYILLKFFKTSLYLQIFPSHPFIKFMLRAQYGQTVDKNHF